MRWVRVVLAACIAEFVNQMIAPFLPMKRHFVPDPEIGVEAQFVVDDLDCFQDEEDVLLADLDFAFLDGSEDIMIADL